MAQLRLLPILSMSPMNRLEIEMKNSLARLQEGTVFIPPARLTMTFFVWYFVGYPRLTVLSLLYLLSTLCPVSCKFVCKYLAVVFLTNRSVAMETKMV